LKIFKEQNILVYNIGKVLLEKKINIKLNNETVLNNFSMTELRDVWEETSFELEKLQCNQVCVSQEKKNLKNRSAPAYKVTFDFNNNNNNIIGNINENFVLNSSSDFKSNLDSNLNLKLELKNNKKHRVAVIRQVFFFFFFFFFFFKKKKKNIKKTISKNKYIK
jgi:hypothetical protein